MIKGDIVRIRVDPLSEKNLEGEAKLIEFMAYDKWVNMEYWDVEFLSNPGKIVRRKILVKDVI